MDKSGKARLGGEALDEAVNRVTAFRTWEEMEASLRRGYVPTIYRARPGTERRLVREVRSRGYRVYTGN
jgi:hypothetical protein